MSREGRYPLAALEEVRKERQDEAVARLSDALSGLEEAGRAREAASERLHRFRREEARRRRAEPDSSRAAALLRREAYRRAQDEREAGLRAELLAACRQERAAEERVERTRVALIEAGADAMVVERHHERWREERARARSRRAQDDAEDRSS